MYRTIFKPMLDCLAALLGLLILSPIFMTVSIALFVANNGKPFFFQKRPGKDERIFNIIKFKTMNDKRDKAGNLLPDAARLTGLGKFIRKTSLDELPQLINVLKGDMSLVGPRPLRVHYLHLYNKNQKKRHDVRPGITGWAQVNGRNAISWKEKFNFDIWYVKNINFVLDLKILILTIKKVLQSKNINSSSNITMEPFNGNN
ncbi:sugar transferase [Marixanthomonas spongiae]|uniref:Lipid carrier--UDP-N-acetylgalactosaminyltransferase n=1 Tax=Marixanthomonas spongiae TaxID=2174845 RepID=A0A2U0I435_9FLAO|nr:sugar transferase [Marixanthomonas spongiae]PVW15750.1 lipid carrier--UDP-N-acetylgalactosaminyltransferase [Marixanthomonas spongiae]